MKNESVKARLEKTLLAWPTNWQDEGATKDAIRAVLKRVEELERENAEFRASLIGMHERAEAAEAEVARLREEAAILRVELGVEYDAALRRAAVSGRADEARAALAPEVK